MGRIDQKGLGFRDSQGVGGGADVANSYYGSQVEKVETLEEILNCFQHVIGNGPQFDYLDNKNIKHESLLSKEIKVYAEVEKIWILFDSDNNGTIDKEEIQEYLQQMAYPKIEVKQEQVNEIFQLIDVDRDGKVDKDEMVCFLKVLMLMQENLSFKQAMSFEKNEKVQKMLHKKHPCATKKQKAEKQKSAERQNLREDDGDY